MLYTPLLFPMWRLRSWCKRLTITVLVCGRRSCLGGVLCVALAAFASKNRPFMDGSPTQNFDIKFYYLCTGHICNCLMRETAKQQRYQITGNLETCQPCALIKGRTAAGSRTGGRARDPRVTFHPDLCGKVAVSIGVSMYLLVYVLDSCSRFVLVYGFGVCRMPLLEGRWPSLTLSKYRRAYIQCFRVDMGTEWTNEEFRTFCADATSRLQFTVPDTSQQNAPVEKALLRLMKGGTVCRRSAAEQFGIPDFSIAPGLDHCGNGL